MKPDRIDPESDDNDETVIRPMSRDRDEQDTILMPHPDETLILEQRDPLLENVPATNPFCVRAASLLSLVPKLRVQASHNNIQALSDNLTNEIKAFESVDPESGISKKENQVASYFLCALIDETILNTPWGQQHGWEDSSLLKRFHNDGQEGRKFFVVLKQLLQNSRQYIHLIELAYICMSLGYEGVYRQADGGARTIAQHRQKLLNLIQLIEGDENQVLSTDWQGIKQPRRPMIHRIPLWIFAAGVGVLLMLVYFIVIFLINQESDEVAARIDQIAQKESVSPSETPFSAGTQLLPDTAPPQTNAGQLSQQSGQTPGETVSSEKLSTDTFKTIFTEEIESGKLLLLEGPTLRITNAFGSGSDRVKEAYVPMLARIARLLSASTARILVVGHTDDQPMFSGRFPSNWHLSEARAKRVANHLAVSEAMAERIRYEGHGASDPIVANDTEQRRAMNRRIDIHIR